MNLERLSRWWLRLPRPARGLLRPAANLYLARQSQPLGGALSGCRMRGQVSPAYRTGTYEPDVTRWVLALVQPGWWCLDVGAHHGYFCLLLAKLVGPTGRVFSFEAHPLNARALYSNVRLNGYQHHTQVENVAIGDGSRNSVRLFEGRDGSSAEWNIVGHDVDGRPSRPGVEVASLSLDQYFTRIASAPRLDFVKLDIEGAEHLALWGMTALLQNFRPYVLVEFHDEHGWSGRHQLFAADYELLDVHTGRRINPEHDAERVYQCLAVPRERADDLAA